MIRHRSVIFIGMLGILALGLAACGGKDDAPAKTADAAVMRVVDGLADNRPEVAWQALPESYQRDVTELVHEAAAKMDPEVWNKSFGLLRKVNRLLDEKHHLLQEHPMLSQSTGEASDQDWKAMTGLFATVLDSELSSLDKLKRLDVEEFLSETGSEVMQQASAVSAMAESYGKDNPLDKLRGAKATLVTSSGDTATVRLETPGQAPSEVEYVRVEDKWITKELAEGWEDNIAQARRQLADFSSEGLKENKQSILMTMAMADGALDSLLAADSDEEFQAAMGSAMGMVMAAMMSQGSEGGMPFGGNAGANPAPMQAPTQAPMFSTMDGHTVADTKRGVYIGPDGADGETPPYDVISVHDADDYLGQAMTVRGTDGLNVSGTLLESHADTLVFEREIGDGKMSFELHKRDIQALHVLR